MSKPGNTKILQKTRSYTTIGTSFFKDNLEYDSSHEFYYISSNFFLIVYDRTAENLYFVHIDI